METLSWKDIVVNGSQKGEYRFQVASLKVGYEG